jgi:hypothetical protein
MVELLQLLLCIDKLNGFDEFEYNEPAEEQVEPGRDDIVIDTPGPDPLAIRRAPRRRDEREQERGVCGREPVLLLPILRQAILGVTVSDAAPGPGPGGGVLSLVGSAAAAAAVSYSVIIRPGPGPGPGPALQFLLILMCI